MIPIAPTTVFIGAYHGIGLLSRAIRWRTWSPISHVAAIRGTGEVIEAWHPKGVRHSTSFHTGHRNTTRIDIYSIALSDAENSAFWAFQQKQIGVPYDIRGVLGFITRRDRAHSRRKWFCSEIIHAASVAVGAPILANIPSHRVYPGMIITSPLVWQIGHITVQRGHPPQTLESAIVPVNPE